MGQDLAAFLVALWQPLGGNLDASPVRLRHVDDALFHEMLVGILQRFLVHSLEVGQISLVV